jgi:hypothetical protein
VSSGGNVDGQTMLLCFYSHDAASVVLQVIMLIANSTSDIQCLQKVFRPLDFFHILLGFIALF